MAAVSQLERFLRGPLADPYPEASQLEPVEFKAVRAGLPASDPFPASNGLPGSRLATNREAHRHLEAYGGKDPIDHVMRCVRTIMEAGSQAEYHFEEGRERLFTEQGPDVPKDAKIADASLVSLFEQPNRWQDYVELFELMIIDLLLTGNAYWLKYKGDINARPSALYRLAPPYVTLALGERTLINHYEYRLPHMQGPINYRPEDIVHFRLPNPHSPGASYGVGLIGASPKVYDIELNMVSSLRSFFGRGTKLSGVLTSDRTVPEPTHRKIQRTFQRMYAGPENDYQVAVLERGLKFQSIQPTAAEAQFQVLGSWSRDRIFAQFGVPVELYYRSDGGLKLSEAKRTLADDTERPLLNKIQKKISQELTEPGWNAKFKIDYSYTMPEEDRVDLGAKFATLPGITIREARQKSGLPPLGPDIVDPSTGDPVDDIVLNLPGPSTEGPDGHPDSGDGPGRPSDPANRKRIASTRRKPNPVNGDPASAADVRRREANGQASRQGKALLELLSADELVALHLAERKAQSCQEGDETGSLDGPDATLLIGAVNGILTEGKALKKSERSALVTRVRGLEAWSRYRGIKERVVNAIAEGVRRGYSPSQIMAGVPDESYEPVGALIRRLHNEVIADGA